ncbi:MAG: ankyrin repeat domain-containing protein [Verrucomicrobiota bacterium]
MNSVRVQSIISVCCAFLGLQDAFSDEIHHAATNDRIAMLNRAIAMDPGSTNRRDDEFFTPLHHAAGAGTLEAVTILIKNGATVNARDHSGITPLHLAALRGRPEIVETLIEFEADIESSSDDGYTPLHLAAMAPTSTAMEKLIRNKADVNSKSVKGATPLYLATLAENLEMGRILLDAGADINLGPPSGPPLFAAIGLRNRPLVQLFIDRLADVNARNGKGATPLAFAKAVNDGWIVDLLVENGAEVPAAVAQAPPPRKGRTPIDKASLEAFALRINADKKREGATPRPPPEPKEVDPPPAEVISPPEPEPVVKPTPAVVVTPTNDEIHIVECYRDRIILHPDRTVVLEEDFLDLHSPLNKFLTKVETVGGDRPLILATRSGAFQIYQRIKKLAHSLEIDTRLRLLNEDRTIEEIREQEARAIY